MSPPIAYAATQVHRIAHELGIPMSRHEADEIAYNAVRMFLADAIDSVVPSHERPAVQDLLTSRVEHQAPEFDARYVRVRDTVAALRPGPSLFVTAEQAAALGREVLSAQSEPQAPYDAGPTDATVIAKSVDAAPALLEQAVEAAAAALWALDYPVRWENHHIGALQRGQYRRRAQTALIAALQILREPDDAMRKAARDPWSHTSVETLVTGYRDMLDALLKQADGS